LQKELLQLLRAGCCWANEIIEDALLLRTPLGLLFVDFDREKGLYRSYSE
jgi:hypothetical protein